MAVVDVEKSAVAQPKRSKNDKRKDKLERGRRIVAAKQPRSQAPAPPPPPPPPLVAAYAAARPDRSAAQREDDEHILADQDFLFPSKGDKNIITWVETLPPPKSTPKTPTSKKLLTPALPSTEKQRNWYRQTREVWIRRRNGEVVRALRDRRNPDAWLGGVARVMDQEAFVMMATALEMRGDDYEPLYLEEFGEEFDEW